VAGLKKKRKPRADTGEAYRLVLLGGDQRFKMKGLAFAHARLAATHSEDGYVDVIREVPDAEASGKDAVRRTDSWRFYRTGDIYPTMVNGVAV